MLWLVFIPVFFTVHGYSQSSSSTLSRPKLVVGIVVDQMRWDFNLIIMFGLYKYYDSM